MQLDKMLDVELLEGLIASGYITARRHPILPLTVYDYSAKCQYERVWTTETLACRGLIAHDDGSVIARPFGKFFNWDEVTLGELMDLTTDPLVTAKMDGSLGITYQTDAGPFISTRGSFTSPQAIWASEWLTDTFPSYDPPDGVTCLFEIIYPSNRIVVDYGQIEELFLLAVIDNETGADLPLETASWPGLEVQQYDGWSYGDAVHRMGELGNNEEGFVCQWNRTGEPSFRLKMKGAEYLRLHRIVTGCSTLTVWEHLKDGRPFDELLDRVPDEFNKWLKAEINKQMWDHEDLITRAFKQYNSIKEHVGAGDRKAFAELATQQSHPDLLFMLYDGKNIEERVWRKLRPTYARPFQEVEEG